jgi:small subunit ribosomal protein S20
MVRTYLKRVQAAVAKGDQETARAALETATPVIDRMANRGIMHKNTAARHKSRLNSAIKALQA